jgi:hypothetical protein
MTLKPYSYMKPYEDWDQTGSYVWYVSDIDPPSWHAPSNQDLNYKLWINLVTMNAYYYSSKNAWRYDAILTLDLRPQIRAIRTIMGLD